MHSSGPATRMPRTGSPLSVLRVIGPLAIVLMLCSCYQTHTSEGRTVRTNTVTGKTEVLSDGKWKAIGETPKPAPPSSLVEDRRGQPCKSPPPKPGESWATEIKEQMATGCTPNRADSTTHP